MVESDDVIVRTKKWISEVVIGCRLCPFAAKEFNRGAIHYRVASDANTEACLRLFLEECSRLDESTSIETTLLILPGAFADFDEYLGLVELAEDLLESEGYEGRYQVAGFHPDYRFADTPDDDPANYTNRSLYPMLHLLREASIENVVDRYPDADAIPERNIAFAREKGLAYMKALRDACF